jgi:hypothetical protein
VLSSKRGLEEEASSHPIGICRGIVGRSENSLHPRQVRLDRFPKRESIGRLKKNFCDQDVTSSVCVDPLHRVIRVCRSSGIGPTQCFEGLRQSLGDPIRAVHDQDLH